VGNIFKLDAVYSAALGARYLDSQGTTQPIVMGSYGIGVGRLMACLAEHDRDERGLIWPRAAAPFAIYLVGLDLEDEAVRAAADDLYDRLVRAGLAVLYDDRDERAGVKFNDADLLGIPLRVTVGRRALRNEAAEVKRRAGGDAWQIPLAEAPELLARE
jgi:prolyl-tRNA synthetase